MAIGIGAERLDSVHHPKSVAAEIREERSVSAFRKGIYRVVSISRPGWS